MAVGEIAPHLVIVAVIVVVIVVVTNQELEQPHEVNFYSVHQDQGGCAIALLRFCALRWAVSNSKKIANSSAQ